MILVEIWQTFLYQPLFNALIWIYNNWTEHSLGWAIIYLTVMLRLILLPFTLVTEKNKSANEQLYTEIERVAKELHNDPIVQKQEIRKILKKRHVNPWAKLVVLGVQILVLALLYQVFLQGLNSKGIYQLLYDFVQYPGRINTMFHGFNLAETHTFIGPAVVMIALMLEIYFESRSYPHGATRSDLMYFLIFPAIVFIVLWYLPVVKSLFVLTSMAFSVIIHQFSKIIFSRPKKKEGHGH